MFFFLYYLFLFTVSNTISISHDVRVDLQSYSFKNDHGYVPLVLNTFRSFLHSLMTVFVTRVTRQVPPGFTNLLQ